MSTAQAPAGQAVTTAAATAPVRHQDKRLVALFFDFSNMPQADQLRARDAAVDFITKQMTASDLVSIMAYGTRFDVLEDFTADRDRLLSRLQKMATGEGAGLADEAATSADEGDDSGSLHGRRHRVQHFQYGSQAERAGGCHQKAGRVSGKESPDLFCERSDPDRSGESKPAARHRQLRCPGERVVLSGRRARADGRVARRRRIARPRGGAPEFSRDPRSPAAGAAPPARRTRCTRWRRIPAGKP